MNSEVEYSLLKVIYSNAYAPENLKKWAFWKMSAIFSIIFWHTKSWYFGYLPCKKEINKKIEISKKFAVCVVLLCKRKFNRSYHFSAQILGRIAAAADIDLWLLENAFQRWCRFSSAIALCFNAIWHCVRGTNTRYFTLGLVRHDYTCLHVDLFGFLGSLMDNIKSIFPAVIYIWNGANSSEKFQRN